MATEERTRSRFGPDVGSLSGLHWVAVGLATVSGVVHLYLYWTQEFVPFLLAGLGFFGIIALILIGIYRQLVYALAIPFTLAQMAAWVAVGMPDFELGVFDKAVQTLLIALLLYLLYTERDYLFSMRGR